MLRFLKDRELSEKLTQTVNKLLDNTIYSCLPLDLPLVRFVLENFNINVNHYLEYADIIFIPILLEHGGDPKIVDNRYALFDMIHNLHILKEVLKYPIDLNVEWGGITVIERIDSSEFKTKYYQDARKLISDEIHRRHS
jgi:hypothetical protein